MSIMVHKEGIKYVIHRKTKIQPDILLLCFKNPYTYTYIQSFLSLSSSSPHFTSPLNNSSILKANQSCRLIDILSTLSLPTQIAHLRKNGIEVSNFYT